MYMIARSFALPAQPPRGNLTTTDPPKFDHGTARHNHVHDVGRRLTPVGQTTKRTQRHTSINFRRSEAQGTDGKGCH